MPGFDYPLSLDMHACSIVPYNQIISGLNERRLVVGMASLPLFEAGLDITDVPHVQRYLQEQIEDTATHFVASHVAGVKTNVVDLEGTDPPDNYTTATLFDGMGLPSGWRRVTGDSLPADWEDVEDAAYTYGNAQGTAAGVRGDIVHPAPWFFEDCRAAIRCMCYTRIDTVNWANLGAGVDNLWFRDAYGNTWALAKTAAEAWSGYTAPAGTLPDAYTLGQNYGQWDDATPPVWTPTAANGWRGYATKTTMIPSVAVVNRYQSEVTLFVRTEKPDSFGDIVYDAQGLGNLQEGLYVPWDVTQVNGDGDNDPTSKTMTWAKLGLDEAVGVVPAWCIQPPPPAAPPPTSGIVQVNGFRVTAAFGIADWTARQNILTWQFV